MSIESVVRSPRVHEQGKGILVLIGISHREAGVELRENLSFEETQQSQIRSSLVAKGIADEVVVFCTCNRTELVLVSPLGEPDLIRDALLEKLAHMSGLETAQFAGKTYFYTEKDVVSHLMRVCSGLDSMILGEPQVTGQIKSSYHAAYENGATGPILNRLFHRAFGATKNVRTKTGIGRRAVSMSYAAKELTRQIFGELNDVSVMLIGAGETGRLASKHLKSGGAKRFIVANRTLERGHELALELGGVAVELSSAHRYLSQADVVIGAGRARVGESLVTATEVGHALKLRDARPQFYIDLGVPRNFEASIDQLADCYLYGVDDLEEVVRQNLDSRSLELESAELIIETEVARFLQWMEIRKVDPAIKQLKNLFSEVTEAEVSKTMKRLRRAGYAVSQESELEQAIRAMANSISSKLLHGPISRMKSDTEIEKNEAEKVLELFLDFE